MKPQSESHLGYVIAVLKRKHAFVAKLGPATEFQQEGRDHLAALELAIDILSHPHYEVNPFA
jgi:hypothetical protein